MALFLMILVQIKNK